MLFRAHREARLDNQRQDAASKLIGLLQPHTSEEDLETLRSHLHRSNQLWLPSDRCWVANLLSRHQSNISLLSTPSPPSTSSTAIVPRHPAPKSSQPPILTRIKRTSEPSIWPPHLHFLEDAPTPTHQQITATQYQLGLTSVLALPQPHTLSRHIPQWGKLEQLLIDAMVPTAPSPFTHWNQVLWYAKIMNDLQKVQIQHLFSDAPLKGWAGWLHKNNVLIWFTNHQFHIPTHCS